MKTIIALVAVTLALSSCSNEPMDVERSPNGAEAQKIAVIEGCNLWRVDDVRSVYVTICPSGATQSQNQVSCGKNCTRPQFSSVNRKQEWVN